MSWRRLLVPLAAAVLFSALISVGAEATGWSDAITYGLAGVAAALLIVIGTPYALFGRSFLKDGGQQGNDVPAVIAGKDQHWHTNSQADASICLQLWEEDRVRTPGPIIVPAQGAVWVGAFAFKSTTKLVPVGHLGAEPNGSPR